LYFQKDLIKPKHLQSSENNIGGKEHEQNVRLSRSQLLDNSPTQHIIGILPKLNTNVPPADDAIHKECNCEDDLTPKDELSIEGILLHVGWEKYFQVTEYEKYGRKLAQTPKEDGVVMDKLILEGQVRRKGRHCVMGEEDKRRMFWNEAARDEIPELETKYGRVHIFSFFEVAKYTSLWRCWNLGVGRSADMPGIESNQTQVE